MIPVPPIAAVALESLQTARVLANNTYKSARRFGADVVSAEREAMKSSAAAAAAIHRAACDKAGAELLRRIYDQEAAAGGGGGGVER